MNVVNDAARLIKKICRKKRIKTAARSVRSSWLGVAAILTLTSVFFWPVIVHMGSYSPGGDAAFNAWTLARDQHCILRENCPNYLNGNIFYPHRDTMLYSETQLSAGLLTLPLFLINQNPIFSYNVWTILSFLFSGLFMFYLARYLSKGNIPLSILAGLVFEFAPLKMAAIFHLQNLSIFYLPLAFLMMFKYLDTKRRLYLGLLLAVLILQFYASWYQMAFVFLAFVAALLSFLIFKYASWKRILVVLSVVVLAAITTLPLAIQYVHFSKSTNATFSIQEQATYSSSLVDYLIPNSGTLLGKLYYSVRPHAQVNAYNPDSYSYHGVTMYVIGTAIVVISFLYFWKNKKRELRKHHLLILMFVVLATIGFVVSLGPLLKVKGTDLYSDPTAGLKLAIPLPYILVDKFLPQLSFIRAIGRVSVLSLFSLCCLLAFVPIYLSTTKLTKRSVNIVIAIIIVLVAIDVLPDQRVPMSSDPLDYHQTIPAAYKFIHNDKAISNYIALAADNRTDYPNVPYDSAISSELIWAGYDNKNMFNGTSGYIPPNYYSQYISFLNFTPNTIMQFKSLGINYLVVDKLLSQNHPGFIDNVSALLAKNVVYTDKRYDIYKVV
ncbi:MAG TPA: hypothetical protein VGS08_02060 [Candidatus Saccharimonadales bacterium]|nr:hypothetical protein [Candidatus Saccharimonadales bacterium]